MKRFLLTLALIAPVLLMLSGAGFVHPLGDSLAVFRFPLGVAAMLSAMVLFVLAYRKLALAVVLLSVAAVYAIWESYTPVDVGPQPYRLYQKNMLVLMDHPNPLLADIKAKNPDFLTLQEISEYNDSIIDGLSDQFQTINYCQIDTSYGVAVLSRFPEYPDTALCGPVRGFAAVKVLSPDGPLWVVSLHLRWPFPFEQSAQLAELLPILSGLDGPVLLAGDFNMVPWSNTVTQIEVATRTRRVGATNGTFRLLNQMTLPIDHVLAPTDCPGRVTTLDLLGSDHHGVLAEFFLKPCGN